LFILWNMYRKGSLQHDVYWAKECLLWKFDENGARLRARESMQDKKIEKIKRKKIPHVDSIRGGGGKMR
jgi:hypothetical protein